MPYATEYRIEWDTVPIDDVPGNEIPSKTVRVSIFDTSSEADNTAVITLQAAGDPLKIIVIDNDENKFTPLRGKQATIQFISRQNQFQDASTFADSSDNRWKVDIAIDPDGDNEPIFTGFLVLTDLQQPFQPDPQIVTLRASDHLAILSDVPLTEDDESNPAGKYRIAELIALCLKKTGLSLNINVINNLRQGSGDFTRLVSFQETIGDADNVLVTAITTYFYPGQRITISGTASNNGTFTVLSVTQNIVTFVTLLESVVDETDVTATFSDNNSGHFYDTCYLDARTFESNINECEDCHSVLSKILGFDCVLFQYKSEWWIVRIDEYESNPFYRFIFDADGELLSNDTVDLTRSIGAADPIRLALADALLRLDRPYRHDKLTFNFNTPEEIICNGDYSRGDPTSDPDLQQSGYTAYELDDWEVKKDWGSNETTPDIKSSIQRSFSQLGDEEQRFIMLTYPSDFLQGSKNYIRSCAIPMSALDRFQFSFDISAMTNPSGDGTLTDICIIMYYGASSGQIYVLGTVDGTDPWINTDPPPPTTWKVTNAELTLFRNGLSWAMFTGVDKRDWQGCQIVGAPVPEEGELRIHLFGANHESGDFDTFNVRYQNLSFEYSAYIGGTYRKYTGQYHKVTRTSPVGYNAKIEDEVFISDSPKPIYKGGIFIPTSTSYHLAGQFWASAPFALGGPPGDNYFHAYGYIQAFSVWNQYRRGNRIFTGTVYGMGLNWVDLLHKVVLSDTNPNTNNRFFLLISMEQNWRSGLWTATFVECFRTGVPKVYSDDHLFKYITE